MSKVRVRFAPSPTGHLHIGGARTALFNWLFARRHQGTFILRIEDTDENRSTQQSTHEIIDWMHWLGLDWDEGPQRGAEGSDFETVDLAGKGPHAPYLQTLRINDGVYKKRIQKLLDEGKAYKCYCTKDELAEMRKRAQAEKRNFGYDGRCRGLTEEQRKKREAEGRAWSVRLRMPDDGHTVVEDLIRGNVSFDNSLLQDLVIQKTTGGPTYNFACVVDDHLMKVTHVIRGDDHLSNTPSQAQIYTSLGWEPPKFAHLSMLHGPDGKKLSKRQMATSLKEYSEQGYLPDAVRNYLALLGWSTSDSQQLFLQDELISKFDIAGCQKSPAVFDPEKLKWMNGEYLRKREPEKLLADAMPFIETAGMGGADRGRLLRAVAMEREKFKLLADVPDRLAIFFKPLELQEKAVSKVLKKDGAAGVLAGLEELLGSVEPFTEPELEKRIRAFCEGGCLKTGRVFHPLRVAVSGRTEGPTLFGMLELLGKEEVLSRIRKTRSSLGS